MSIETALYARLSGFAGLTAVVGARIYPNIAPPDADAPFVTYQRVSGERLRSLGGAIGYAMPRFQLDAWAGRYATAQAVAAQLRAALVDYTGTPDSGTVIHSVMLENDQDLYDDGAKLHRVSLDFRIEHSE